MDNKDLWIDLSDIRLDDLEVLSQEGARAIPEFAASTKCCGTTCYCGSTACTPFEEPADAQ